MKNYHFSTKLSTYVVAGQAMHFLGKKFNLGQLKTNVLMLLVNVLLDRKVLAKPFHVGTVILHPECCSMQHGCYETTHNAYLMPYSYEIQK